MICKYMLTKKITLYADEENNQILVKFKSQSKNMYDYKIYHLPHDPEYWSSSGYGGIKDVHSFLQTPRGERWLINKIHNFADEYETDFVLPKSFDEVKIW